MALYFKPDTALFSLSSMMNISKETEDKVRLLLQQNRKVEAVKLVYDTARCGLKEAKDYVDQLRQPAQSTSSHKTGNNIDDTILSLLAQNKKLYAIKFYREQTGKSLAESLAYVDSLPESSKHNSRATTMNTEIDKIIRQQEIASGSRQKQGAFLLKLCIVFLIAALLIYLIFFR